MVVLTVTLVLAVAVVIAAAVGSFSRRQIRELRRLRALLDAIEGDAYDHLDVDPFARVVLDHIRASRKAIE